MLLHLGRDDASFGRVVERRRDRGAIGVQALLAQLADDARQTAIVVRRLEGSRVHLLLQFLQLLDEALNRDRCHPTSSCGGSHSVEPVGLRPAGNDGRWKHVAARPAAGYTSGVTAAHLMLALVAAAAAGAVNAIAGGGTLLTFPAIVGLGVTPLVANATSTVALWPGSLGSMWGYRGELVGERRWVIGFAAPSVVGGALGAWLLLHTAPAAFARIVPFLVLGATVLFLVQRPLLRRLHVSRAEPEGPSAGFLVAQF